MPDVTTRVEQHLERIDVDGYTVVEGAIEPELLDALDASLSDLEALFSVAPAENAFEGTRTLRVYNLLAYGAPWTAVPTHPAILPIVEGVLDSGCLVSSLSSIGILPGETPQPIHADDQLIPLAKPHAPTVCNTMWALTDFTEANGATRIVPGSHRWENPDLGTAYDTIAAEMPRGSVLVWHGSLWHGGGANTTEVRRTGIAMNYCAGFVRQQENQQLGIPREVAATFDFRLRELVGYGIYHGLIGHIDKRNPAALLGPAPGDQTRDGGPGGGMVWDVLK
jgi:ectoine hydroxylase-related dioxygenase (phytanoyl-CoA dioxygenase family)